MAPARLVPFYPVDSHGYLRTLGRLRLAPKLQIKADFNVRRCGLVFYARVLKSYLLWRMRSRIRHQHELHYELSAMRPLGGQ